MDVDSIRIATYDDIDQVAVIHKQQFPSHFLSKYSINLIKQYYNSFLGESIFWVGEKSGQINGFLIGGKRNKLQQAKNRFIKCNKYKCLVEILLMPKGYCQALFRIKPVLLEISHKSHNILSHYPGHFAKDKRVRLLLIAVRQETKGSGLATQLIQQFEQSIRLDNVQQYVLTAKKDNHRAICFYKKNGFIIEKEEKETILFIKNIL